MFLIALLSWPSFSRQEETTYQVDTELIALSLHEPVEGLYYVSGGEVKTFRGGIVGMGIPMPYRGPARLKFYREPPVSGILTDSGEPAPVPEPIAGVDIPENQDRVFLLLDQREGAPLRIHPFPASFDEVDAGSYRVFNFASSPVSIMVGEKSLRLESHTQGLLDAPSWREKRQDLQVVLGTTVRGEMKLVYSHYWGHDPQRRYFVFVFDGAHTSAPLRIRKVYDRPPPPDRENN